MDRKKIIGVKLSKTVFKRVENATSWIEKQGWKKDFRKKPPSDVGDYWVFKQKDYSRFLTRREFNSNGPVIYVGGFDEKTKRKTKE
mgnify:CR=1 FL=1